MRRYGRFLLMACMVSVSLLLLQGRAAQPAEAAHHVAEISEVMSGFGGNPNIQYVEINQLSTSQNFVKGTRLTAFNAAGSFISVLLTVPGTVPNSGNGVKWIMGTTAFQTAAGISADFTFSPGILPAAGMMCWGAPGVVPENPPTWTASDPNQYVDCVSYGGTAFTGTNPMSVSGPNAAGAGDGQLSLTRRETSTGKGTNPWRNSNDATAFNLAIPSPTNNAGAGGSLGVGGIAEAPGVTGTPLQAGDSSGTNAGVLAGAFGGAAAVVIALGGAAWYARRRWLR